MALKILHLIDSGGLYGAENMLLDLVEEQQNQGLQPLILSAGTPDIEEKPLELQARRRGLPVKPFRMRAGLNFRKGLDVVRFAQSEGFDILHSHGYKFNILLGLLPRKLRKIPLITTLHGYVHASPMSKMWFNHRLDNLSLKRMDAVVCVSEATRESVGLVLKNAIIINNGILLPNSMGQDQVPRVHEACAEDSKTEFVIAAFGRLASEKGFQNLIRAFAMASGDLQGGGLTIWGDGYLRKELEMLVSNENLSDRVALPGYTEYVDALLKKTHLLVIPSHTEGLPMILLEAMKNRVPIIASAVGAIPEVLDSGRCGILVQPGDVESLSAAIRDVYDNRDEALARAELAYQRLGELYSSHVMERQYHELYTRLTTDGI